MKGTADSGKVRSLILDPDSGPNPDAVPVEGLHDDLDRIDGLLPLWERFGEAAAEERRAAAGRLYLELISQGAGESAPASTIERLLAVNLVVVQAAALDCLQRNSNTYGPSGQNYLRQGTRLMELCRRLADSLDRAQTARRRERQAAAQAAARAVPAEAPEPAKAPEPEIPEAPGAETPADAAAAPRPKAPAPRNGRHRSAERAPSHRAAGTPPPAKSSATRAPP